MDSPFVDMRAQEIPEKEREGFFVEPKYMHKLISSKAAFIQGERGSGKTTILRHLEKMFNESLEHDYIGVYLRFETMGMKSLNNTEISKEQNTLAFAQTLNALLGKTLCDNLLKMREKQHLEFSKEEYICKTVAGLISTEISQVESVNDFYKLKHCFEKVRSVTRMDIQNGVVKALMDYAEILDTFCLALREEDMFKETCVCVLFDEYENLTLTQQSVVNSCVKASSYYLTYKVCMRPEGFIDKNTVADREPLMVRDDYESLDYVNDILGSHKDIKKHVRDICAIRLRNFYNKKNVSYSKEDLMIDNYLMLIDNEDELQKLDRIEEYRSSLIDRINSMIYGVDISQQLQSISSVVDLQLIYMLKAKGNALVDILENMERQNETYKNWRHNYEKNAFYQILMECEQNKKYCGLEVMIKISHYNIRKLLEILHYTFGDYADDGKIYPKASVQSQTAAIGRVSQETFDQIGFIPITGLCIKNFVNALGNLFYECIKDKEGKKFEANNFSIVGSGKISKEQINTIKNVIKDAVMWGVLVEERATKVKNAGGVVYENRDYTLNPIFSPYFKISYRKRQKYDLTDDIVYSMFEPRPKINREKLTKNDGSVYEQIELKLE